MSGPVFKAFAMAGTAGQIASDMHRAVAEASGDTLAAMDALSSISMLGSQVLLLLARFARTSHGTILEFGPYIGGSTVALAMGIGPNARRLVTVEKGGSFDHPDLPTHDIESSLRENLARFGVSDRVELVLGELHDPRTRYQLRQGIPPGSVGLLVIDADGRVAETFAAYASLLAADCLVVVDDYRSALAQEKEELTAPVIDQLVREGALLEFGVFGEGSWFGKVGPAAHRLREAADPFRPDGGACYTYAFVCDAPADSILSSACSGLRVFEDGIQLGPGHTSHADIRAFGHGRFSHWQADGVTPSSPPYLTVLYFSASDNSDPNRNGRVYEVEMMGSRIPLPEL